MQISGPGILQSSHWFLPKLLMKRNNKAKSRQGKLKGNLCPGERESYKWMNFLVYKYCRWFFNLGGGAV